MSTCEVANISRINPDRTIDQIVNYYNGSPGYLTGPLGGTCHFGYTPLGQRFELHPALLNMETQLGEALALAPGSRVLDGGCGFGRVAKTLSSDPYNLHVLGADLISERLKEARRFSTVHGVAEKVSFFRGNYCELPFRDETVDGVYTMETLVHADPVESALGEFRRVLIPGGGGWRCSNTQYQRDLHLIHYAE